MIRFSNIYNYNELNTTDISNEEIRDRGNDLIHQADELLKMNCIKKIFCNEHYIREAIYLYVKASDEFKSINNINLCMTVYDKALEQCIILDKFQSLETIGVLMVYFSTCNKLKVSINNKYIEYFYNFSLNFLETLHKNIKIANIYKLIAKNYGDTELAIKYYEKSNQYYRKTNGNYTIEENNKAILKINRTLGKNVIWH